VILLHTSLTLGLGGSATLSFAEDRHEGGRYYQVWASTPGNGVIRTAHKSKNSFASFTERWRCFSQGDNRVANCISLYTDTGAASARGRLATDQTSAEGKTTWHLTIRSDLSLGISISRARRCAIDNIPSSTEGLLWSFYIDVRDKKRILKFVRHHHPPFPSGGEIAV
jgi:predicted restriction endonuclease